MEIKINGVPIADLLLLIETRMAMELLNLGVQIMTIYHYFIIIMNAGSQIEMVNIQIFGKIIVLG